MKKEKEQSSSEEQKAANENLLIRLNQNYGKLSKGQKRLADFITAHYDQAVSMTAARLGQQVGVSESTTVRFAMQLGYAGYPEFQRALEEMVMNRLNSVQRMQFTYGRVPQGEILETVLQSDIEKIKMTLEEVDRSAFERAADTILSARTIYIVGIRSCAPLASFLAFYLHMIFPDVRQVQTNSSSEIFEQMIRITEDDVVIGISFPRYSLRTVRALRYAKKMGAAVIGVFAIIILKNNLQIFERIGGDFRSNRIYEWLSGGSYQILQGLYAIGSGGFLGKHGRVGSLFSSCALYHR